MNVGEATVMYCGNLMYCIKANECGKAKELLRPNTLWGYLMNCG